MRTEQLEPRQAAVVPTGRRVLIGLAWGLVQFAIVGALFTAGGIAGGYLSEAVAHASACVPVGLLGGAAAGMLVSHRARTWLLRYRRWRLRAAGVGVTAMVRQLDSRWFSSPRGGSMTVYVAHVYWRDPVTGTRWEGARRYRFWGRGSRQMEAACARGTQVKLYYPTNHPARFVIDIPFAPTMADLLG